MRLSVWRLAAFAAACALLLSLTVGCWGGEVYYYVAGSDNEAVTEAEIGVGEAFKLHAREHETGTGCDDPYDGAVTQGVTWKIEPAEGAAVEGGRFIASKPGVYTVTPVFSETRTNVGIRSVVFTVAGDGSTTVTPGDGIDYAPLLGMWTYPIRIVKWDDVETWKAVEAVKTETMVFSLGAGGVLKVTRDGVEVPVTYDGTTVTVGDPATTDGAAPLFIGTISGDTISGRISYPGGGKMPIYDANSETGSRDVDLAMAWTATRKQ